MLNILNKDIDMNNQTYMKIYINGINVSSGITKGR